MIALYIFGALVLLIVLVLLLRVGVTASFGQELQVKAKVGPVKLNVYPKPEKKVKKAKNTAENETKKEKLKLTFNDLKQVLPILLQALEKALGKVRRRMRVDPLRLSIVIGDSNPARVAEMYGWASTAVWTLMPPLEQLLHIPDPRIHLEPDYNNFSTRAEGELGISFRIGELLHIVLLLAVPLMRWYLPWQKAREAAAVQTEQTTNV